MKVRGAVWVALLLAGCVEQVSCAEHPDHAACEPWVCCTDPTIEGCEVAEVAARCGPDGGGDAGPDATPDGGGDAGPCGMACPVATPVCDEASGECVQCTAADASACTGATALCDTAMNLCVACLGDGDCTEPGAARCDAGACVPCDDSSQCASVPGDLGVCAAGSCVQCTAAERAACGANVCDGSTNACTTRPAQSADLCQDCVADAECQDGQLCVPMTFMSTAVGNFCLWREDAPGGPAGSCTTVRPYRGGEDATSVDGAMTRVCNLRLTTCAALGQFDSMACTVGAPPSLATDAECGVSGLDDGLCRMVDAVTNRCTVPCLSDDDCFTGSTCSASPPRYCQF